MRVIDEAFLRAKKLEKGGGFLLEEGDVVTPMAIEYADANKIKLQKPRKTQKNEMPVDASGFTRGGIRYFDAVTGAAYAKKPEDMTHLSANLLVKKSHPRIAFRGALDCLEAQIMETQSVAQRNNSPELAQSLQEILLFVRSILAAEVKEIPFKAGGLIGYTSDELRSVSHNPQKYFGIGHPVPDYTMGEKIVRLNSLRTEVRRAELSAVNAFAGKRGDIVGALNRLSSAIYILILKELAEK